ncbi:hypothetical protein [Amycolatopsis sp. NPDC004625]
MALGAAATGLSGATSVPIVSLVAMVAVVVPAHEREHGPGTPPEQVSSP